MLGVLLCDLRTLVAVPSMAVENICTMYILNNLSDCEKANYHRIVSYMWAIRPAMQDPKSMG